MDVFVRFVFCERQTHSTKVRRQTGFTNISNTCVRFSPCTSD